jgi:hypothetical protein
MEFELSEWNKRTQHPDLTDLGQKLTHTATPWWDLLVVF